MTLLKDDRNPNLAALAEDQGQVNVGTVETLTEVVAENAHSDRLTLARMTAPACLTFVTCTL